MNFIMAKNTFTCGMHWYLSWIVSQTKYTDTGPSTISSPFESLQKFRGRSACGKVKHESRVTSHEFESTSYEFKSTNQNTKSTSCKIKSASWETKGTSQIVNIRVKRENSEFKMLNFMSYKKSFIFIAQRMLNLSLT